MNKYFDINDTVYNIVSANSEVLPVLINSGLDKITNSLILNTVGRKISLNNALKSKNLNVEIIEKQMVEAIENEISFNKTDVILNSNTEFDPDADVTVGGVLPCPIRIPLQESFEEYMNTVDFKISHNLKSANLGIDDIKELALKKELDKIPDVLMSAGFELFFDKNLMGHFFENGDFKVTLDKMNKDFDNDYLSLIDPKGRYAIAGVVPAIFIVNKDELNGRKVPETWEDLLSEEFEDSVGIPMSDLDLFNAIIIHIYKLYGDDGIKRLARSYNKSLHPSQMVKSSNRPPAVSVSPYFFSTMVKEGGNIVAVWPKDGAIISPIFLVAKSKNEYAQRVAEYFLSENTGYVLSGNGKFPATNKNVDNHLNNSQRFIWLGFDYIYSHDIGQEIRNAEKLFNAEVEKGL